MNQYYKLYPKSMSRLLSVLLAVAMILSSAPMLSAYAEGGTSVSLLTTEITSDTDSVEVEINELPSAGILRVIEMGESESYDSSKLNNYTSLNFSLLTNLSEGKNSLALTGKPTTGKKVMVVIRDASGEGTADYTSNSVVVASDSGSGSGYGSGGEQEGKTPAEIIENCKVTMYKDGEVRTDKFTTGETSTDVKVILDEAIESCYLIIYAYPGNASFDPDADGINKRLWSGQVTNGFENTCNFIEGNLPLPVGYKVVASLNVEVSDDYYLHSNSQVLEVVDENGEGFKDYEYPDISIDEDTLSDGDTSLHISLTGDERLFAAAAENKIQITYSIGMYPDGEEFDFEGKNQISLLNYVNTTEPFSGKEVKLSEPLKAGYRVRAVVYWSQDVALFVPKGNDYESSFGKPDDSVLITAASTEPKLEIEEPIYVGSDSCNVKVSGDLPDGVMMSVKSYPAGTDDPAYDKGTIQKFLASGVSVGTVGVTGLNDSSALTEGTIVRAFLLVAGNPIAASDPVTIEKEPAPEVSIVGKLTTESTTIPVKVTGNIPSGAKIILFTFGADATEFPRDYSVGKFLESYTGAVNEGTTTISEVDLSELSGRQLVAFLVDGSWNDVSQSEPVRIPEPSAELSVEIAGDVTTASESINVDISGDVPSGSILLVKSYPASTTTFKTDQGTPQGVTAGITVGTVTHTLTNAPLTKGHKVVAFVLNGGEPVAASEPAVVAQGAYSEPEIRINDSKITAGMTKLNYTISFDKSLDSVATAVYKYTGDTFNKSTATEITSATQYNGGSKTADINGKITEGDKLIVVLTQDGKDYCSDSITVEASPDWGTPSVAFDTDSVADTATEIPLDIEYADEYLDMEDFYCNVSVYMFDKAVDDDVFEEDEYWESSDKAKLVARANASAGDVTRGKFNIKVLDSAELTAGKKLIIKLRLPHTEWEGEEVDYLSKSVPVAASSEFAQGPSAILYNVDFSTDRGAKIKAILDKNNVKYKIVGKDDMNQVVGYLFEKKGYVATDELYDGELPDGEFMAMNAADWTAIYEAFIDDGALVDQMSEAGVSIDHKAVITEYNVEWKLSQFIEDIAEEHEMITNWTELNKLVEEAEEYADEKYSDLEGWSELNEMIKTAKELLEKEEDEVTAEDYKLAAQALSDTLNTVKDDEAAKKAAAEKAAADKAAAEKAAAEKAAKEKAAAAEAKAKTVTTVTVNTATVNASAVDKAVKAAGGSNKYVTRIVLGKKVKKLSKGAFKNYRKVKTLEVKTKKLKKASVKKSLTGSKVTKVKVNVGKKKVNKKYIKKYKKIFTKKNAGKKAKVA